MQKSAQCAGAVVGVCRKPHWCCVASAWRCGQGCVIDGWHIVGGRSWRCCCAGPGLPPAALRLQHSVHRASYQSCLGCAECSAAAGRNGEALAVVPEVAARRAAVGGHLICQLTHLCEMRHKTILSTVHCNCVYLC